MYYPMSGATLSTINAGKLKKRGHNRRSGNTAAGCAMVHGMS
jgi:hypothetical protein